jgi:exonuclease III
MASTFIKEILLKHNSHTEPHTLILGDLNTQLSTKDRPSRQKLNREIKKLTDILNQIYLTDIHRIFHQKTKQYAFSATH